MIKAVKLSEPNSVVLSLQAIQTNFVLPLEKILQWWVPYVANHSQRLMWLTLRFFKLDNYETDKVITRNETLTLKKIMKLELLYKVGSEWQLNPWLNR